MKLLRKAPWIPCFCRGGSMTHFGIDCFEWVMSMHYYANKFLVQKFIPNKHLNRIYQVELVTTASWREANVVYSGGLCGEGTYRTSFRTPRAAPQSLASARCYGNSPNPPPQMLQAAWSTLNSVREIEKEREITTAEKHKNCCSEKGEGVRKPDWPKKRIEIK